MNNWIPVIVQVLILLTTIAGGLLVLRKTTAEADKMRTEARAIDLKADADTRTSVAVAADQITDTSLDLVKAYRQEVADLRERYITDCDDLHEKIEQLDAELSRRDTAHRALQGKVAQLQCDVDLRESEIQRLRLDLGLLEAERDDLLAKMLGLTTENSGLKYQMEQLQAQLDALASSKQETNT